jgi:hypothetical protein
MVRMGIDIRSKEPSPSPTRDQAAEARQAELKQDRSSPVFISRFTLLVTNCMSPQSHTTCQRNISDIPPQPFCNITSTLASTQPISASFHHDVTHLCAATIGLASNTRPAIAFPTHRELSAFHVTCSPVYFLYCIHLSLSVVCFLSAACWTPIPLRWLTPPRMSPS